LSTVPSGHALRWSCLLAVWLVPTLALADSAAAEALFREGRRLLAEGRTAEACEKLAASQRLDPSSGTLLNLADCQSKEGKTASAWASFVSAATLARTQGNAARATEAEARARELEAKLAYLVIRLSSRPEGIQVRRGSTLIEPAMLDTRLPVDPGKHTITASAPGHAPWTRSIDVEGPGLITLVVPPLERTQAAAAGSSSAAPPPPSGAAPSPHPGPGAVVPGRSPTAGYVVGGVGLVLTGVGAYLGLRSLSSYRSAEEACPTHRNCPASAQAPSDDASSKGTLSTVALGLGAIGLVAGTWLVLTAGNRESNTPSVSLAPVVGPRGGSMSLSGSFW
jgi:hypothetical protein